MTVEISKEELYNTSPAQAHLVEKDHSVSKEEEDSVVNFFFKKCHSRYPVLHRHHFTSIRHQKILCSWDQFILNIVFAIGSRYMELVQVRIDHDPEYYYQKARAALEQCQLSGLQHVQACMLNALYSHRAKNQTPGPTVWHLIGMSMRTAVEIGLHRRQQVTENEDAYQMEFQKRLFWSVYLLDRLLGLTLGRPFAVPEHDIDIQLPVDVDDHSHDFDLIHKLRVSQEEGIIPPTSFSNMASVIRMCELRRIESQIQASIYNVNRPFIKEDVGAFSIKLDSWLDSLPSELDSKPDPHESKDYFYLCYYRAKRLLLAPQFNSLTPGNASNNPIFMEYARVCGGICQTYRSLNQNFLLGFSPVSLQTLFLAGLSLAYCVWIDKQAVGNQVLSDIRACSNVLFVMAERWPNARKYRDVFEDLIDAIFSEAQPSTLPVDPNIFNILPEDLDFTLWQLLENNP